MMLMYVVLNWRVWNGDPQVGSSQQVGWVGCPSIPIFEHGMAEGILC
jgi:hypothetical protein